MPGRVEEEISPYSQPSPLAPSKANAAAAVAESMLPVQCQQLWLQCHSDPVTVLPLLVLLGVYCSREEGLHAELNLCDFDPAIIILEMTCLAEAQIP